MNRSTTGQYLDVLRGTLGHLPEAEIDLLTAELIRCFFTRSQVFICGNGGSAANAAHIANDLAIGISSSAPYGVRASALTANFSVLTCIANDKGYENVFSSQLEVLAQPDDLLLILSGSGNSLNLLNALEVAKLKKMKTAAILGYDGGKVKALSQISVHCPVSDMQVSEDLQLIIAHSITRAIALHVQKIEPFAFFQPGIDESSALNATS